MFQHTLYMFMCPGATATFSGYTSTMDVTTTALHFSCTGTESNLLDCASYVSTLHSSYYIYGYYYDFVSSDELCSYTWRQNVGVQCNGMFHLYM